VGQGGSGTVFFSNCNLRCVFCINWEISQGGEGEARDVEALAEMMLRLRDLGCHNINIVTPTHYSPHIVLALDLAAARGLKLPLVYNTCGWERLEVLQILDGIVDIYLPDFKYSEGVMAAKYSSGADTYPEVTQAALLEMHRQVGVARPAADGLMYRGLMIRHLVMPNGVSGSKGVIDWIAENLPKDTYLNIMSQYTPTYKATDYPEISRRITRAEYAEVIEHAEEVGLTNLDIQGMRPF
jgi:putative pyruvate formate lyase activating enzyme